MKLKYYGDLGESNSRPLAPKASIIPLDQSPLISLYFFWFYFHARCSRDAFTPRTARVQRQSQHHLHLCHLVLFHVRCCLHDATLLHPDAGQMTTFVIR